MLFWPQVAATCGYFAQGIWFLSILPGEFARYDVQPQIILLWESESSIAPARGCKSVVEQLGNRSFEACFPSYVGLLLVSFSNLGLKGDPIIRRDKARCLPQA